MELKYETKKFNFKVQTDDELLNQVEEDIKSLEDSEFSLSDLDKSDEELDEMAKAMEMDKKEKKQDREDVRFKAKGREQKVAELMKDEVVVNQKATSGFWNLIF